MTAISEAIAILHSDESRDTAAKVVSWNFMQMKKSVESDRRCNAVRREVLLAVEQATHGKADIGGSLKLVVDKIDSIVSKLEEAQRTDDKTKDQLVAQVNSL